jgi:glucokinase
MSALIIGVEIGGTKLQVSLATPEGKFIFCQKGSVLAADGARGILAWFSANLPGVIARASELGAEIKALGCGFGGPINTPLGQVIKSIHIQGWDDFPLRQWFEDQCHLPVVIANDTNAAAWGEYCLGSGRGTRQFFYTNIGTGIGGGAIINGELFDGQGFGAAEFGQTFVPDWTASLPGREERLENLCSGLSIEKRLRSARDIPAASLLMEYCGGDQALLDCRMLGRAAEAGDERALAEVRQVGRTIGIGLANILCLLAPETIAIGGGVSGMGEVLMAPIRESAREHEFVSSHGHYKIVPCELQELIVLEGAVLLAARQFGLS